MNIGIIGSGFVGGAIGRGFAQTVDVKVFDIDPKRYTHKYEEVVAQDIVFVCLPTPMLKTGECDTSIIERALDQLSSTLSSYDRKITCIKSTVPPQFLRRNFQRWPNLEIVYSPEFLTERTADLDLMQSSRFIFGTKDLCTPSMMNELFALRFPRVRQVNVTWEEASLIKNATNVFFTVKLSFANELAQLCDALGLDFKSVGSEVLNDGRIGRSHFQVPGHDGNKGWGGHCFIKDCNSWINFSKELGVDPTMARAAWEKNIEARSLGKLTEELNRMQGRASSQYLTSDDVLEFNKND